MSFENLPNLKIKRGYNPKRFVEVVYNFMKARNVDKNSISPEFINDVLREFLGTTGFENMSDTRYKKDELYRIWESYVEKAVRIISKTKEREKERMLEEARNAIMAEDANELLEEELERSGMTEAELRDL